MIAFSYDIIKLPTTGKAMTVRSSDARSPGGWLVSLGIGALGAFILSQVMPTAGALAQTGPDANRSRNQRPVFTVLPSRQPETSGHQPSRSSNALSKLMSP